MSARRHTRGQPVVMLVLVLGGWIALRAATWESPFTHPAPAVAVASASSSQVPPGVTARRESGPAASVAAGFKAPPAALPLPAPLPFTPPASAAVSLPPDLPKSQSVPAPLAPQLPPKLAAAHNFMLLSGLSSIPLPPELAALLLPATPAPASAPYQPLSMLAQASFEGRWSGDGWLLLRQDNTDALASGHGSYGRSQAGAVIRYRLAPGSPQRPQAYVRASKALGGANESELALGFAARPLARLPLSAAAELRVTRLGTRNLVRPAALVVTELPPFELPLGLRGEAYAQAGYVGGEFASAFADGQMRAERPLTRKGAVRLSAGAGMWGGAQKDAARLDIGPSATLAFGLAGANSRVSMDWRFRIAGEAQPASGPALTISAGF